MSPTPAIPESVQAEILGLHAEGASRTEIAEIAHVATGTVYNILHRAGVLEIEDEWRTERLREDAETEAEARAYEREQQRQRFIARHLPVAPEPEPEPEPEPWTPPPPPVKPARRTIAPRTPTLAAALAMQPASALVTPLPEAPLPRRPPATVTPLRPSHAKRAYRSNLDAAAGTLTSFLPGYELHLRSKGAAEKTIEKKLGAVRSLAAFLGDPDAGAVVRSDIERWMTARLKQVSRASVATEVIALRSFFGPLKKDTPYLVVDLGSFDSPMEGITAPQAEEKVLGKLPEGLLPTVIGSIEKKRAKEWEDIRDLAVLRCFADTGCRLSEITNLKLTDIIPLDDGRMLLRVFGKGRGGGLRERHVPLATKAGIALRRYLRVRSNHPHAGSDRLWLGRKGPIKPHGMREMIYRRSTAAGQRINPHALRHDWAVKMKIDERNRDADIMHLAGWIDSRMLDRYGKAATAERAIAAFYAHGAPGDAI